MQVHALPEAQEVQSGVEAQIHFKVQADTNSSWLSTHGVDANSEGTCVDSTVPYSSNSLAPATASTSASPKLATTFDMGVMALVPHLGEVTRTWGSSSDWVLELRDGRRLSIPVSLLRPYLGEF